MTKRRGNGEGSITKRKDGRWQGVVTVGYDPETEKPKKKYFYSKTRKEVQKKVNEALGKIQSGTYSEPSKMTMAEWLDTWLNDYMKPALRPTTWSSYEIQVRKHIKPEIGQIKLSQLQTSNLQRLYNEKLKNGRADNKKGGLSPRSVKYIHTVIHSALEQAKREHKIMINPADAVKLPINPKKEMRTLNTDEIKIFLAAAKETNYYMAYLLELATGLRRGELLALRWKDVDLDAGAITVSQGLVRTKEGLIFQEPKTSLSRRTVNIPADIAKDLKTYKKKQEWLKESMGEIYDDKDLVFCNEKGKPIDPRSFTRHFERLLKRAGLPKICFHDLRHTFATLSLQEGVSPKTIQENLGHHNAAFTMNTYSHVTDKMKKEATDKIGNLLASCMK